jgi:hypothetical protein
MPLGELMRSFEQAFRIPPHHRLEQIKTRACGSPANATYWDHVEYDGNGQLIARYHTFREPKSARGYCCGWRKYDSDGCLIDVQDLATSHNNALFGET